eukprot:1001514-Pyramimonas_sp.AAC.1
MPSRPTASGEEPASSECDSGTSRGCAICSLSRGGSVWRRRRRAAVAGAAALLDLSPWARPRAIAGQQTRRESRARRA